MFVPAQSLLFHQVFSYHSDCYLGAMEPSYQYKNISHDDEEEEGVGWDVNKLVLLYFL